MDPFPVNSIDNVIKALDQIIEESLLNVSPAGYFAALYRKVTIEVKKGIASGYFDDALRMEQLDIAFAKRYLDAYAAFRQSNPTTDSWQKTFDLFADRKPIVLQHLLMGMNAHINLDLGIAAAQISEGHDIAKLQNDFNKINEILSALVHEVEDDLSAVWPFLKIILKHTGEVDDYLVDFSMKLARDGAWKFACQLSESRDKLVAVTERDKKVAAKTSVILKPGLLAGIILWLVRITERGSVTDKIRCLT